MQKVTVPHTLSCQQLYLSYSGRILESCDSLFRTDRLLGASLTDAFPVLESCWLAILQMDNACFREFTFPAIHLCLNDKHGKD